MKNILEHHLQTKIIPFWTKLADYDHGGFYGYVSRERHVDKLSPKGLVQQARFLWSFSAMYLHYQDSEYLKLANHAYDFVVSQFDKSDSDRFIWLTGFDGRPLDTRLVTYGQAFAIYALSEYYRAFGKPEALALALRTFKKVETSVFDNKLYGYIEEFDHLGRRLPTILLADGIPNVVFTANTLIHLLEAYTSLFRVSKQSEILNAIINVGDIISNKLYDRFEKSLLMYLDEQYRPLCDVRHYGHEIEFSWLLDETMAQTGIKNPLWETLSLDLAVSAIDRGWNGRYLDALSKRTNSSHIWWVSSEALFGLWNLYEKTKDPQYYDKIVKLYASIQEDLVDPDPAGEWFWSKDSENSAGFFRGMGELWKTPYHNVRSLLRLIERM